MTYEEKQRRQQRNREIFKDTESRYAADAGLAGAVRETVRRRKLILEGDPLPETLPPQRDKRAEIIVSGRRSFEAARRYAGRKVCVLNFASATGPGGGVRHGSSAQEESLCRCSTLYPALADDAMWNAFYAPHRETRSRFYNDDIIYCPDVVVFKSDGDFPELLPGKDRYKVDVLTCAAPNLRHFEELEPETARAFIRGGELEKLLEKRIRRIFGVAAREGARVLILGAFGCGAFRNPPELVASVFRRAAEEYGRYFETIEFAVFHMDHESPNHRAFCRAFADLTEAQAAHAEPITGAPASEKEEISNTLVFLFCSDY